MSEAPRPIFVIGNPRSGTTLLRLMLTCHPAIAVPPEAGFAMLLFAGHHRFSGDAAGVDRFLDDLAVSPKFEHWKLPRGTLAEFIARSRPSTYAELVSAVYMCYASIHQPGKSRWGDKNNFYLNYVDRLAALFPSASFVHIVRDGRDVACSYRSLASVTGRYAPTLPVRVFEAARDWRANLDRIEASLARVGQSRWVEIRYEDIVADAAAEMHRLCDFLGESYSPRMLSFDEENRIRELEPREFDAWKSRTREGLDPSGVGRWRREFSLEETAVFEHVAGRALERHGYELTRPPSGLARRLACARMGVAHDLRALARKLKVRF